MTQVEKIKHEAILSLKALCARCKEGVEHRCPVVEVVQKIESLRGVPVIVNDQLYHVVFN